MPVGLFGEHRNTIDGWCRSIDSLHLVDADAAVGLALAFDDGALGAAPDLPVHRVGGLEGGDAAARSPVGQTQRLQHLIRAVGHEDPLGIGAVLRRQIGSQRGGRAVGIAVPFDAAQLGGERLGELGRRPDGRLVGVEPHLDVDLRRVVAVQQAQVVAHCRLHGRTPDAAHSLRRDTEAACAHRPSASASSATAGASRSKPASDTSTTCIRLVKSSVVSAPAKRAVPAVGSTCDGPAT